MAGGRFISSTLGDSERFSNLTDARHQVAFVLIVTWADAEGRFIADPVTLNGKLFTRLGWTPDVVDAALTDLHRVGLITLYRVDGKPYGIVERFHEHNRIRRKDDGTPLREAASKLPAPPEGVRGDSAVPPPPVTTTPEPLRSHATPTAQQLRTSSAAPQHEVEVQVQLQVQVEETPPTPLAATTPPPPELVEAPPRRGERPPTLEAKKGKARDPASGVRAIDQPYVDAWNENRGPLARIITLGPGRERSLDRLRRELGDEALDIFRDAVRQVAKEPTYAMKGYNFGHLISGDEGKVLKWAEKWRDGNGMTNADRRLADKAKAVADAIGGLT